MLLLFRTIFQVYKTIRMQNIKYKYNCGRKINSVPRRSNFEYVLYKLSSIWNTWNWMLQYRIKRTDGLHGDRLKLHRNWSWSLAWNARQPSKTCRSVVSIAGERSRTHSPDGQRHRSCRAQLSQWKVSLLYNSLNWFQIFFYYHFGLERVILTIFNQ